MTDDLRRVVALLEREMREAIQAVRSGDRGKVITATIEGWADRLRAVLKAEQPISGPPAGLDQALNSGDGSYHP
jgi:hypothetical protein